MSDPDVMPEWLSMMARVKATMEPDFTIICGDAEHRVHKLVMSSASTFFEKACNGPFKEGQTSLLHLPDDDPDTVEFMVEYMYKGTYAGLLDNFEFCHLFDQGWAKKPVMVDDSYVRAQYEAYEVLKTCDRQYKLFPFYSAVYKLADKYDIRGLKGRTEDELVKITRRTQWNANIMKVTLQGLVNAVQEVCGLEALAVEFATKISKSCYLRRDDDVLQMASHWPALSYEMISRSLKH